MSIQYDGRFKILTTLGQGAFGKVRLAIDLETGERVAVKELQKSMLEAKKMTKTVAREITTMKMLKHENVIALRDVLQTEHKLALAMELASGGELFDRIANSEYGSFEEPTARFYFRQLTDGVEYCHERGFCHRDLKLENLLLAADGTLKISDFGFSTHFLSDSAQAEQSRMLNSVVGTLCYLAPEVLLGRGYSGRTADIWSCGVILYVMVCGQYPFNRPDYPSKIRQIKAGAYDPLPDWISIDCGDLIGRMLDVNVDTRITMRQIRRHRWVTSAAVEPLPPLPREDDLDIVPDAAILEEGPGSPVLAPRTAAVSPAAAPSRVPQVPDHVWDDDDADLCNDDLDIVVVHANSPDPVPAVPQQPQLQQQPLQQDAGQASPASPPARAALGAMVAAAAGMGVAVTSTPQAPGVEDLAALRQAYLARERVAVPQQPPAEVGQGLVPLPAVGGSQDSVPAGSAGAGVGAVHDMAALRQQYLEKEQQQEQQQEHVDEGEGDGSVQDVGSPAGNTSDASQQSRGRILDLEAARQEVDRRPAAVAIPDRVGAGGVVAAASSHTSRPPPGPGAAAGGGAGAAGAGGGGSRPPEFWRGTRFASRLPPEAAVGQVVSAMLAISPQAQLEMKSSKHKLSVSCEGTTFAVRAHPTRQSSGGCTVEFERRMGDSLAFQRIYRKVARRLLGAGNAQACTSANLLRMRVRQRRLHERGRRRAEATAANIMARAQVQAQAAAAGAGRAADGPPRGIDLSRGDSAPVVLEPQSSPGTDMSSNADGERAAEAMGSPQSTRRRPPPGLWGDDEDDEDDEDDGGGPHGLRSVSEAVLPKGLGRRGLTDSVLPRGGAMP